MVDRSGKRGVRTWTHVLPTGAVPVHMQSLDMGAVNYVK